MNYAAFHQGLHCLLRLKQPSGKEIHVHHDLETPTCDNLKYTMGSPILIVSICMGKPIRIQRVSIQLLNCSHTLQVFFCSESTHLWDNFLFFQGETFVMYIQMNSSSDFMTWKNLAKVCIKHYIYILTLMQDSSGWVVTWFLHGYTVRMFEYTVRTF